MQKLYFYFLRNLNCFFKSVKSGESKHYKTKLKVDINDERKSCCNTIDDESYFEEKIFWLAAISSSQMPWQIISFIFLFITLVINTTCPYFRKSRRGILISHWMVINWTMSNQWNLFINGSQNPFILFLPISTLFLAADQLSHQLNEDDLMNEANCFSFITALMMFDAFILTLIRSFNYEMGLITLFAMVMVFIVLLLKSRKRDVGEKSFEYLRQNSAYCFFNDCNQPFNCFGRLGYILYFALFCIVFRQLIPSLKFHIPFNYFLYIFLTIGTFNFIRTPVYIGGFVQSVKNIGAGVIELFNKRKQINQLLET